MRKLIVIFVLCVSFLSFNISHLSAQFKSVNLECSGNEKKVSSGYGFADETNTFTTKQIFLENIANDIGFLGGIYVDGRQKFQNCRINNNIIRCEQKIDKFFYEISINNNAATINYFVTVDEDGVRVVWAFNGGCKQIETKKLF